MDLSALPDDFFVTAYQFTKTTFRDQYPAIDPTSQPLSQAGKVVIVTGASQGLGRQGFAPAFVKAGAKTIVLVARNEAGLESAAQELRNIRPDVNILTQALDVRDEGAVRALFERIQSEVGTVDVLVNNAGGSKSMLPIRDIDPQEFWYDFELNVKGTLLMSQGFLRLVGTTKPATIINITSAAGIAILPHTASYSLAKLVQIQLQRFIAAENPNVTAVSLHPGTVHTALTMPGFVKFSKDTFELAGGVAVWLASEKAKFMNGRYMGVNWSVGEMEQRKDEIVSSGLLLPELQGKFGIAQFEA